MISKKWLQAAAVAGAVPFILTACGGGGGEDGGDGSAEGSELSGQVGLDGSSTVAPLSEVAAELFMEENNGVQVSVATSGTGGGFERFCNGETDMNNASREIKDDEAANCEANDIAYEGVQVANDALAIVVNPDNPIDCLTVDQATQIWDEGSTVTSWGDVDDLDAGDLAGEDITLYGPGSSSGTFDYFTEAINGEEGQIRNDYTDIGEDDQAAIVGVEGDVNAMAYIPYSYFTEAGDAVKPLLIDGGDGECVEPTLENVQNGSYAPLGRGLFVYASDVALERPEAVEFMSFYVENSEAITETAGFVPMTEEQMAASHEQIESLTAAN
ncbi:phosphate ABC transporter substrate-binding protein (PhoT family) [Nocardiopsis sp. Huas11]|uniref:PstS family phosphate ABC transporter substrate-binding protein n=1 Tax=Nocardiopsis sp. Huas11 TaxID=2183912 RepID=UPI000EB013E2|nr:PstS family phosphate ABC transporter substrate-binding protein [Nocardiopsis sp. Huas11]RKS06344.1 phosphate ABC transporter substrate-binding protein (PhoT family) [Nocardiopsis sp. Huas11]